MSLASFPRSSLVLALLAAGCPGPDGVAAPESTTGDDTTTSGSGPASSSGADESTDEEGPMPFCGDGVLQDDEECDEGQANANDGSCTEECTAARCGDGWVWTGNEQCDDGNEVDDDGCSNACQALTGCGDGVVDEGEECDEGPANDRSGACLPDCTAAICGDGMVQAGVEQCDDANAENNDACTELCAPPTCGDGFVQTVNSELCDDGDPDEGDECNADCTTAGLWTDTYNGAADNNDSVYGVAADSANNVIVAGETFDAMQGDNVWVRKYAPDGSIAWTQTYHGVTADTGWAVAVASNDDVLVAGSAYTLSNGQDAWLRRYSPAGATVWTQTYDGAAHDNDEALGVAVDPSGNVVVTGYTTTAAAGRDIWVRKYSSAGAVLWTRTAAGTGGQNDEGHGVATDGSGNVIVTGYAWGGSAGRDIWVRKYDAAGNEQWTRTYDGPSGDNDEGNGVATDGSGNVIVVGYETSPTGRDIWVRQYDDAGAEQWTATYNAPQDGGDTARGVVVDADDQIVVVGSIYRGTQSDNIWVRKYAADGTEIWTSTYNSDGFGSDVAHGVATDPDGNVAVGGYETRTDLGEFRNAWVRRILQ